MENVKQEFDWHNYNESQAQEKILFMQLLRELCDLVNQPKRKLGRKPVDYSDIVYALALKGYLTFSSRRVQSDLKLAAKVQQINKGFHFNTLLKYLESMELRHILIRLIEISALPVKQIEADFAIDSTGFGTSIYSRWLDIRNTGYSKVRAFRKCHCVYGVKTNVITSVDITAGNFGDSLMFKPLVQNTANNFSIREVSADKAYSSRENMQLVSDIGGVAYIPFRSNASGKSGGSMLWKRMFIYFTEHREEFLKHYHKRSNAEAGFSMIKRRFGNNIRCKKELSQDNEILLKVLCHNICVLVQEIFLSDIEIDFKKCANVYIAHK